MSFPKIIPLEERIVLSATIIYVDANIAKDSTSTVHNGSSWADAYADLQSALTQAASIAGPTQIWIAEGTYYPSDIYAPLNSSGVKITGGASGLNTPQLETFNLPNNTSLYGGLLYGDKKLSDADPSTNLTILDGQNTDWHVVTAGDDVTQTGVTATLDGLYIEHGNAAGGNSGGIDDTTLTVSPFLWGHSDGGGLYMAFGSDITVNDVTFEKNSAAVDGGAIFSNDSTLVVKGSSVFENNSANISGGAIEVADELENGVSHTATIGGGFASNTAGDFGGAISAEGDVQGSASKMTINGGAFTNNNAEDGGALSVDTLKVNISGTNTFTQNTAVTDGGAIATTNLLGALTGATDNYVTTITGTENFIENSENGASNGNFLHLSGLNFPIGGGAVAVYIDGSLNVSGSGVAFTDNTTNGFEADGGAILNGDGSANLDGVSAFDAKTVVNGAQFSLNNAVYFGGALASESDGLSPGITVDATTLNVTNASIDGNSAARGGAIYGEESRVIIKTDTFDNNSTVSGLGEDILGTASTFDGFKSSSANALTALEENDNTYKPSFVADDIDLS